MQSRIAVHLNTWFSNFILAGEIEREKIKLTLSFENVGLPILLRGMDVCIIGHEVTFILVIFLDKLCGTHTHGPEEDFIVPFITSAAWTQISFNGQFIWTKDHKYHEWSERENSQISR